MSNPILLAPGPVQLHPEVEKILGLPMIHHRTPEFDQILKSTLFQLKKVFQTAQPVFALSSTGSGGMECLLVNVLSPGDKVLALVAGKFGERWADMAEVFGATVLRYNIAWGETADLNVVKKYFLQHTDIKIVLSQACETSTATQQPIEEIAKFIDSQPSTLFLVDGITALGAYHLPMDEWHIDGMVGGSQKAFMLPTGMSFVSFSKKAWEKINNFSLKKTPQFYFNIQNELKANLKGETLFSSNVTLIRALDYVLKNILTTGLEKLFQEISARSLYTQRMAELLNLKIYSKSPSPSVTALELPQSIDGVQFRNDLEKKFQVTVMGGQDQLKGKIIRLGHMGYITKNNLHDSILKIAELLIQHGHQVDLLHLEKKSQQFIQEIFKWQ